MKVSVLITSHNAAPYIEEAIASALNQTYPPVEVVVVDDGSTDGSRDFIASYGHQIILVRKRNGGQYSAHNTGFAYCSGQAVAFLDGDDVFAPQKLELVVAALERYPEAGSCFHPRVRETLDGGERTGLAQRGVIDFTRRARLASMPSIATTTSAMTIRRSILDEVLPLPEDMRIAADDHILKWACLAAAPAVFLEDFLAVQRIHSANYSLGYGDPARAGAYSVIRAGLVRSRYPQLALWADRVFIEGCSAWRKAGGSDAPTRAAIAGYLGDLGPAHRAIVAGVAKLHTLIV
jgi:glycosyltransferase involved in cell wall biosynthesis